MGEDFLLGEAGCSGGIGKFSLLGLARPVVGLAGGSIARMVLQPWRQIRAAHGVYPAEASRNLRADGG